MRRNSSTIPFGYKLASDDKTLVPVAKEIESLNEMKDGDATGYYLEWEDNKPDSVAIAGLI